MVLYELEISVRALASCIALQQAKSNHSMCADEVQLITRHVTINLAKEVAVLLNATWSILLIVLHRSLPAKGVSASV